MELRRSITAVDGGVLMEEIDGECKDGAEKKHYCSSKMVIVMLEVRCWR